MGKGILTYFIKVYQRILSGINFYLKGFAVPAYKVFSESDSGQWFFPNTTTINAYAAIFVPELFIRYLQN
jgi:hypothetical protein